MCTDVTYLLLAQAIASSQQETRVLASENAQLRERLAQLGSPDGLTTDEVVLLVWTQPPTWLHADCQNNSPLHSASCCLAQLGSPDGLTTDEVSCSQPAAGCTATSQLLLHIPVADAIHGFLSIARNCVTEMCDGTV